MLRFFDSIFLLLYIINLIQTIMKHLAIVLLLLITFKSIGQSSDFDKRLLKKFSQEELNNMTEEEIKFNTYCIQNAFFISDFPEEKTNDQAINGARKIDDVNNINFFELNIPLKEDAYQYFRILGSDKLLSVKPIFLIKSEIK